MELNERKKENLNSVLEGDKESIMSQSKLLKYKRSLFFNILICFIVCIILVCERVFRGRINDAEILLLEQIQPKLAISFNLNSEFQTFYYVIGVIGDFKFYCLIMTHVFISMYVCIDAIVGLKGLFVHCLSLYILTLLELLYQGPRPYWISENLQTFYCDSSFTNPSVLTFGFFFDGSYLLSLYLKKKKEIQLLDMKLEEDDQEDLNKITLFLKFFVFGGILIAHIIVFLRYIIGLVFLADYVMALIYCGVCFALVKYFDYHIENAIKSSTVLKKKAREVVYTWIIFLILAILTAYIIYLVSEKIMAVSWLKNYMNCVLSNGSLYEKIRIENLMGPYPTFIQTSILFGLVAGILGAQFCFNLVPNINWYKGTLKKRLTRGIIVNLCLIPSWILVGFQNEILETKGARKVGLNNYAIDTVHFALLYFALYGLIPILFNRLKLTHQEVQYSELINKNEK